MKQKGFTLIEVVVTLGIFLIVSSTMVPAFIMHMKENTRSEVRTEALGIAQNVLDRLRVQDPASMPASGTDPVIMAIVGSTSYQAYVSYCLDNTYCSGTSRHIQVEVESNGKSIYSVETVFSQLK